MSDASSFCVDCERLNLTDIFNQKPSEAFAENLGKRVFNQQPHCRLCRAFWEIRCDQNANEFDIWTGSFLAISSEVGNRANRRVLHNDLNEACIFAVPTTYDRAKLPPEIGDLPYLARRILGQKETPRRYGVRKVEPRPDYALIKNWIAQCRDSHALCRPQDDPPLKSTSLPGLRVIDVQTRTIEDYQLGQNFVTLSYVWGTSFMLGPRQDWQSRPGAELPDHLPQTIKDAIEVTRELGLRRLWIDQYCIDQTDKNHITSQIGIMGQIYGSSELTIIAAAGESCEYGLPGVSETIRTCQRYQEDFGDIELVASPARPERLIHASKWSTRGWTFQEAVLARRRLVFTDEQIYFECKSAYNFESLDRPMAEIHSDVGCGQPSTRPSVRGIRRGYFENALSDVPNWSTIRVQNKRNEWTGHFRAYLKRELRYQSDLCNAFRGVQDQYYPSFHGLSLFNLSARSNTRQETQKDLARSLGWLNGHWARSVRRLEFPSFTWAGWTGTPFIEQVQIVEREIEFLNIDDWKPGDRDPACLEVKASTAVFSIRLNDQGDRLSLVRDATSEALENKHYFDTIYIPYIAQSRKEGLDLLYEVECILLFTSLNGYCFLAIKRVEDWIERVGLLELDKADLPELKMTTEWLTLK